MGHRTIKSSSPSMEDLVTAILFVCVRVSFKSY